MPTPQVLPDIAGKEEASRSVEYFRSVYDLFKSSQQVTGAIQRSFIIGGYRIRLSFSGAALLSLTRALEQFLQTRSVSLTSYDPLSHQCY